MIIRRANARGILLLGMGGVASFASAQSVNLTGTASGFFNAGPATSYGGLSYLGSTFDVNSASDGFYALGGNAAVPNLNNLGSFSLSTSVFNYNSPPTDFTLDVDFTSPSGISGGQTTSVLGTVTGTVSSTAGGVEIAFPSTPQSFSFKNSSGTGTFTLQVNDLALHPGQTDALTGQGTAKMQAVPEPSEILGMTMGIAGLGLLRRGSRRLRRCSAQVER